MNGISVATPWMNIEISSIFIMIGSKRSESKTIRQIFTDYTCERGFVEKASIQDGGVEDINTKVNLHIPGIIKRSKLLSCK